MDKNKQSTGRVAIITGATSGIGEATARTFIAAGYGVIGNGRNTGKLAILEKEIGPGFIGVAGDAADSTVLNQMFASAAEHFAKEVSIVVVNAGVGLDGSVQDADLSKFESVLKTNVLGAAELMQRSAKRMADSQKGGFPDFPADIVVVGSVVGRHVSPFSAVYGASKHAVHALAEGLRREVGPKGVRVSLVEPGIVLSGFQDSAGYSEKMVAGFRDRFGPLLVGADVASAILFLVSQAPHVHISDIVVRPTRQDYP